MEPLEKPGYHYVLCSKTFIAIIMKEIAFAMAKKIPVPKNEDLLCFFLS